MLRIKHLECDVCKGKNWIVENKFFTPCYKCYPAEKTRTQEHRQEKQLTQVVINSLIKKFKYSV